MAKIIVLDDESKICKLLQAELTDAGHTALSANRPRDALRLVCKHAADILITDLRMPDMDGITVLKEVKRDSPSTDVIVMTAYASIETALETMKQGAYDYIVKPFTTEELLMLIRRLEEKRLLEAENRDLRSYLGKDLDQDILGHSKAISLVKKLIADLTDSETSVLIRGESGTGKELVAKAIHNVSKRSAGPFLALNCTAIPEGLLESELFGFEKGAFTGADRRKLGHFQLANGGTMFLDEIGDLPVSLQAKLLRVLENQIIRPLGGEKELKVNIRLISATHRPIEEFIAAGQFREDLFYRINVFPITIPPLRDRVEDIPQLTAHFLRLAGRDAGAISDSALEKLSAYPWPGNIRELRNVVERATIICPAGQISPDDIHLGSTLGIPGRSEVSSMTGEDPLNLEEMEKQMIRRAIEQAGGNKSEAARLLGITRRALYGRLERYGIDL
ncbi:MAG: sigma-54 dependent transcriptional regulator [Candidatus Latescibacterota bacterium]